ncbi:MAG: hypothetical protein KDA80_22775 [Planctomycetaceae bacterium]|nr:hypothetical protein [Planctomycetaceae bacterium]
MKLPLMALLLIVQASCEIAPPDPEARQADAGYDEGLSDVPPPFEPEVDEPPAPEEPTPISAIEGMKPIDLSVLNTGEPVAGGEFNKFFPEQNAPYDIVFKQEKEGFALVSLQQDGEEIAQLSITDLRSNALAAEKFKSAMAHLDGYPLTNSGSKGTVLLVGNRYQVQVRSANDSLDENQRKEWLKKFNLQGLEKLDS